MSNQKTIIGELEALAMLGLDAIAPEAIADAKALAITEITKELTWAKAKLSARKAELPNLTIFHGKLKDEVAIGILEVDILIAESLITALSTEPAPTEAVSNPAI